MDQVYCGHQSLLGIEAIIFDKDGTLADSAPFLKRLAQDRSQACAEAVSDQLQPCPSDLADRLLATLGVWENGLDPDGLMATGTRQSNIDALAEVLFRAGVAPEVGIHALVADQFALVDRTIQPKARHTPPFPGTGAMLQRLSQAGVKLGVLSSDGPANVEDFLIRYDLMPWITDWQGTAPGDPPKPNPALLHRLCERLGVAVAHTVIVGDSWADAALADNAGIAFLSVSEAWGRPPVVGASLILTAWEDLHLRPDARPA